MKSISKLLAALDEITDVPNRISSDEVPIGCRIRSGSSSAANRHDCRWDQNWAEA